MKPEKIATEFAANVRAWLTPEEWAQMVAADSVGEFSNANDFCDANQALLNAFCSVVGREPFFPADVDDGLATESDVEADFDTLDAAWRLARAEWAKGGAA